MNEGERIYHDHVRSALQQLWNWVGERERCWLKQFEKARDKGYRASSAGKVVLITEVKEKMQTLFAGLIEFNKQEESKKNGL